MAAKLKAKIVDYGKVIQIILVSDGEIKNELPLAEEEVTRKKARLRQISQGTYFRIFPEERDQEAEPGAAADGAK